uniref:Uncharacterized protein n=1 Tax=Populus trichocarpa TaxID=3694 RepID=A0A3N7F4Q6_POPTR
MVQFKVLTSGLPSLNQLLATGSTDKMVKSFVPFLVLPVKQRELSFPFPSQRMTLFFSLWEAPWANCNYEIRVV